MAIQEKPPIPIIISGTGPAALLLGHALLQATPPLPFRLYERDLSMTYRAQGYRFVVTGRGVKSCREILTPEHYELLRATSADNQAAPVKRIGSRDGERLPGLGGKPGGKNDRLGGQTEEEPLKVDRTVMRQVLFKGLEDYTEFGKEIVGYEDATNEQSHDMEGNGDGAGVLVRFADGSTMHGALLVGADGAFSRVRQQLAPEVQLLDSEIRMVLGKTPITALYTALGVSSDDDPRVSDLFNSMTLVADPVPRQSPLFFMFEPMRFGSRGSAATIDPDIAATLPSDYVYWCFALRSDEQEVQRPDWRSIQTSDATDMSMDLTKAWLPALHALVSQQDPAQTVPLRSGVMSVPILDWRSPTHDPLVTLIGDAAHTMPPTGGVGATTALTDAAVLGTALAIHGASRQAIKVYEGEMRVYATTAIERSLQGGKMFINMRDKEDMKPM